MKLDLCKFCVYSKDLNFCNKAQNSRQVQLQISADLVQLAMEPNRVLVSSALLV